MKFQNNYYERGLYGLFVDRRANYAKRNGA